jgi:hypothetical protein
VVAAAVDVVANHCGIVLERRASAVARRRE